MDTPLRAHALKVGVRQTGSTSHWRATITTRQPPNNARIELADTYPDSIEAAQAAIELAEHLAITWQHPTINVDCDLDEHTYNHHQTRITNYINQLGWNTP